MSQKILSVAQSRNDNSVHCFIRMDGNIVYLNKADLLRIVRLWHDSSVAYHAVNGMATKTVMSVVCFRKSKQFLVNLYGTDELKLTNDELRELMDFIATPHAGYACGWAVSDLPKINLKAA